MIELSGVSKYFANSGTYSIKDISFSIADGERLVLLGSSGSGKTTVLRLINRLIEPNAGEITIDGENIKNLDAVTLRRTMGYVFQGIGLFPHLTVQDNIAIQLKLAGIPKLLRRQRACEMLSLVNLDPTNFALRYPDELSGGQQQRVGVARALANNPKYLLMDEPLGALDNVNRQAMQQEILQLADKLEKTIIFVTHDIPEALLLGHRIAILDRGQLQQIDTPEKIVAKPANEFVRNLTTLQETCIST